MNEVEKLRRQVGLFRKSMRRMGMRINKMRCAWEIIEREDIEEGDMVCFEAGKKDTTIWRMK